MGGALVLLRGLDEAGDEARRLELTDELSRRLKVVLLGVQEPIPLPEGPLALRVDFPAPTARLARQIWRDELAGRACGDASPRLLADKYVLRRARCAKSWTGRRWTPPCTAKRA